MTIDYMQIWLNDYRSMLATMANNLASDLSAGYDFFGRSIQHQLHAMQAYAYEMDAYKAKLESMDATTQQKAAKAHLKKRGVIE